MSDSVWPHRRQPTRLSCPRDSPGKNTGVGCHFLLQCMKVKSESQVVQSCPTLHDPMDCRTFLALIKQHHINSHHTPLCYTCLYFFYVFYILLPLLTGKNKQISPSLLHRSPKVSVLPLLYWALLLVFHHTQGHIPSNNVKRYLKKRKIMYARNSELHKKWKRLKKYCVKEKKKLFYYLKF